MADDGVHCWCMEHDCSFDGYVVLRTGKILPGEDEFSREFPDEADRFLDCFHRSEIAELIAAAEE
ncbi:hypothetical protein [Roseibium sp. Sym1]|uniref:hypothetical protein n=1 Tax=Roseibium sp. Sym1 TaxID=3016006 RepID=UPI0022B31592|nr:hypothetical protein [Roseibium sp. Sym1]